MDMLFVPLDLGGSGGSGSEWRGRGAGGGLGIGSEGMSEEGGKRFQFAFTDVVRKNKMDMISKCILT